MVPVRSHEGHWRSRFACGGMVLVLCALAPTGNPPEQRISTEKQADQKATRGQNMPTPLAKASKINPVTAQQSPATAAHSHDKESNPKWTDIVVAGAAIGSLLFTAALWLSTHQLWVETRRLAAGAETQSIDMKASIAEATRAATAMADLANEARLQTVELGIHGRYMGDTMLATNKIVEAATAQSISAQNVLKITQRIEYPTIIVTGGKLDHDSADTAYTLGGFTPNIEFMNIGRQPAILVATCIDF